MAAFRVILGDLESVIIIDNASCHQRINDLREDLEIKYLLAIPVFEPNRRMLLGNQSLPKASIVRHIYWKSR